MTYRIDSLAAFDPTKLALKLAMLPDGARVFGLEPTGPLVAWPKRDDNIVGAYVYEGDHILIYTGDGYYPLHRLAEHDGYPVLLKIGLAS